MGEEGTGQPAASRQGVGEGQAQGAALQLAGDRVVGQDDAQERQHVADEERPVEDLVALHPVVEAAHVTAVDDGAARAGPDVGRIVEPVGASLSDELGLGARVQQMVPAVQHVAQRATGLVGIGDVGAQRGVVLHEPIVLPAVDQPVQSEEDQQQHQAELEAQRLEAVE